MSKILTIFGATGTQGGSVIDAVRADPALSKEYTIRGVTRDVTKPAAKALADKGVQMVSADMNSIETAKPAVQGAHTVFFVTNYWEKGSAELEESQGKAVADASKAAGVEHLIFSSLINAAIEQYIRGIGIPATFIQPGFYMSNYITQFRKNDDGSYTHAMPVDGEKARVPVFDAASDTGLFAKAAIKDSAPSGKRILAATDYLTPNQIVADFTAATGKKATYKQVSNDVYKSFLPAPVAQELLENMLLLQDPGYYAGADLSSSLALLDRKPTTWKEFAKANKGKWA
uniref:NmrA-like domain-containing protein n=1 Tax=Bionectria ochroleuca TaxID=29856 RepID=A0A8H7NQ76_BIOOC